MGMENDHPGSFDECSSLGTAQHLEPTNPSQVTWTKGSWRLPLPTGTAHPGRFLFKFLGRFWNDGIQLGQIVTKPHDGSMYKKPT